ncbi:MAG: MBL fold metallo-hydrolase [Nitrospinaceae bacterium]|nr:MBL fold metallo-hydrolase [Nitrospinaceae bacterium]
MKNYQPLSWSDFPETFTPFFLNPTGANLETKELGPGVYALLSSIPNVDNAGFVVGEREVLVIDAHINVAMARQIQERVREVSDKPIRYLVNSNYHGDHTFGNCAFPADTLIVQHRQSAALVEFFEQEMAFMLPCVGNDKAVFEGVELRRPDIVFDDFLSLDLGGIVVEIHHFGPANTPGDTVTYVPSVRAAWTGNMTGGNLIVALESDAPTYMNSIARFAQSLEIDTLIPAHNPPSSGALLGGYLQYLSQVTNAVRGAVSNGRSLGEAMKNIPLDMSQPYAPPADHRRIDFFRDLHAYNVQKTYQSLSLER